MPEYSEEKIAPPDVAIIAQLNCQERLDCPSPEMFHEVLPGAWNIKKQTAPLGTIDRANNRFRTELDPEDVKLVNGLILLNIKYILELGQLSADKLMEYVRNLQSTSLSLGEEEAKQFIRTKCLGIFNNIDENNK